MDLFPGITLPDPDYSILSAAIKENCESRNLQMTPFFESKVLQVTYCSQIVNYYNFHMLLLPNCQIYCYGYYRISVNYIENTHNAIVRIS